MARWIVCLALVLSLAARAAEAPAVPEADQQEARALLRQLYDAYQSKNLDRVMALIQPAVEASALDYEAKGKGSAQEIRDAFRAFHEDLLHHPDFHLNDFNDKYVVFEPGADADTFVIASPVPVILSDSMTFTNSDGTPASVLRLRLGRFKLHRVEGKLVIAEMDL